MRLENCKITIKNKNACDSHPSSTKAPITKYNKRYIYIHARDIRIIYNVIIKAWDKYNLNSKATMYNYNGIARKYAIDDFVIHTMTKIACRDYSKLPLEIKIHPCKSQGTYLVLENEHDYLDEIKELSKYKFESLNNKTNNVYSQLVAWEVNNALDAIKDGVLDPNYKVYTEDDYLAYLERNKQ